MKEEFELSRISILCMTAEPPSPEITHKTGLIILGDNNSNSHELRSWGRSMAFYKESNQAKYVVDDYHKDEHKKRHNKFIRKNSRFLRQLLGEESELLVFGKEENYIRVLLTDEVYKIVSADVRAEVYFPISYFCKNRLKGGTHAYIWWCCSSEQSKQLNPPSLKKKPVTSIVTGMCMFGTNIKGIDQHGFKHPLTNTFYVMPKGAKIGAICLEVDELHPYENMMLRLFEMQIPMLKALGGGASQKIFYQCVYEEYVLYGINMFLRGEMSRAALNAYVIHVNDRVETIRNFIARVCKEHDLAWDNGKSTLRALFQSNLYEIASGDGDIIDAFMSQLGMDPACVTEDMTMDERLELIRHIFYRCLDLLGSQKETDGEVWGHIRDILQRGSQVGNDKYDVSTLLTINYLNYAAKVATVRKNNQSGEVCLIHPFHEKAMALSYKELHSERFGPILAINWIPPIFSHGSFKDGLYYLDKHKSIVNKLIDDGILDSCAMETAAEQVDDPIAREIARKNIIEQLSQVCPFNAVTDFSPKIIF
ncbi:hypothetical protein E0E50_19670 [Azotobacter chroococcum subsp. isscasi]|uniref:hypothetical protein n=1 Tax=Azotobacter chroococcum TaxID=353 RepID=UPI00103FD46A|nr:hypothetical protein [Azotobacter chroococcum]TBW06665.1 hypothetical protein E0E50_19670 [Azotobacter chroococcum subsp. isscasi]